jgi:hypothetical protein
MTKRRDVVVTVQAQEIIKTSILYWDQAEIKEIGKAKAANIILLNVAVKERPAIYLATLSLRL